MDDIDHRIRAHMRRVGADHAHHTDPLTHATTHVLRDVLNLVRAALDDEDIPRDVATRIIDRVIYGATPMPSQVEARQQLQQALVNEMRWTGATATRTGR